MPKIDAGRIHQDIRCAVNFGCRAGQPRPIVLAGQIGSIGNWGEFGKLRHGLEVLRFTDERAFEPFRVAATPDGRYGFVANIGSGSVTVVDLEKSVKVRDLPTGEGAEGVAVAPDGSEVWITNRSADTISILDVETLEIETTIPCPGFPIRVAITPDVKMPVRSSESSERLGSAHSFINSRILTVVSSLYSTSPWAASRISAS